MITQGPVEVVEGSEFVFIDIRSSLPPRYRCNSTDSTKPCQVKVTAYLEVTKKDLMCRAGKRNKKLVPQAVIGMVGDYTDVSASGLVQFGLSIKSTLTHY